MLENNFPFVVFSEAINDILYLILEFLYKSSTTVITVQILIFDSRDLLSYSIIRTLDG